MTVTSEIILYIDCNNQKDRFWSEFGTMAVIRLPVTGLMDNRFHLRSSEKEQVMAVEIVKWML